MKNEDRCLIWINQKEEWDFVIILAAHNTAHSAELVLKTFGKESGSVQQIL
ncbi:hypothetical protein [Peribacillus frigoritolerans]